MKTFTGVLRRSVAAAALAVATAGAASAITFRDDVGEEGAAAFAADFDGVVQIYVVNGGGVFFNCTGAMINPRTVLSAAHCFNDAPSDLYTFDPSNPASGLYTLIGFGDDTSPSVDAFIAGLSAREGAATPGVDLLVPLDAEGGFPLGFPGADVAMIATAEPLDFLPSYATLFSPVDPGAHTISVGYGRFGPGSITTTGIPIGTKRLAGENILGAVASRGAMLRAATLSPVTDVQFTDGTGLAGFEQVNYVIDFDNPDADPDACSRPALGIGFTDIVCGPDSVLTEIDTNSDTFFVPDTNINWFPTDDALPNEVGVSNGDSGSPLIFDQLGDQPFIGAVLSGGEFYSAPVFNGGFGSLGYYTPLFHYHDFISENNPYKYVTAAAGDGAWSDASRWTQMMDPGYFISDGAGGFVNGLPDGPEPGLAGSIAADQSGTIFDTDVNDFDVPATFVPDGAGGFIIAPAPGSALTANAGAPEFDGGPEYVRDYGEATGGDQAPGGLAGASSDLRADGLYATLPGSTVAPQPVGDAAGVGLASGPSLTAFTDTPEDDSHTAMLNAVSTSLTAAGPGSTGFVPNNTFGDSGVVGDPTDDIAAQFFDVTLSAAGRTTVDLDVEIDRLTINGAGAELFIAEPWEFESIIAVEQSAGLVDVDGGLFTREYMLMGGALTGDGSVTAETVFNIAGLVDPGAAGEIGALSVTGDYVQTSAGMLAIDIGPDANDLLAVSGAVSLDGAIMAIFQDAASMPAFGDSYTAVSFTGDRIGAFSAVGDNLPGVLFVRADYTTAGQVNLVVDATSFLEVLGTGASDSQVATATLYDDARTTTPDAFTGIFSAIDVAEGDALAAAFDLLAPKETFAVAQTVRGAGDLNGTRITNRLTQLRMLETRAQAAYAMAPEAVDPMDAFFGPSTAADEMGGAMPHGEDWAVFGEFSYDFGDADTVLAGVEDDIGGTSFTVGADKDFGGGFTFGAAGSWNSFENEFDFDLGSTDASGLTVATFGMYERGRYFTEGYASFGVFDLSTERRADFGTTVVEAQGDTEATQGAFALNAGAQHMLGDVFRLTSQTGLEHIFTEINAYTERGEGNAYTFDERTLESTKFNLGARGDMFLTTDSGIGIMPSLGLDAVWDFNTDRDSVVAGLVGGTERLEFLGAEVDDFWLEADVGLDLRLNARTSARLGYIHSLDRDDFDVRSAQARLRMTW